MALMCQARELISIGGCQQAVSNALSAKYLCIQRNLPYLSVTVLCSENPPDGNLLSLQVLNETLLLLSNITSPNRVTSPSHFYFADKTSI